MRALGIEDDGAVKNADNLSSREPRLGVLVTVCRAIMKCASLCPSVSDLFPPADFCLLHLTVDKLVFSVLLTKKDN